MGDGGEQDPEEMVGLLPFLPFHLPLFPYFKDLRPIVRRWQRMV